MRPHLITEEQFKEMQQRVRGGVDGHAGSIDPTTGLASPVQHAPKSRQVIPGSRSQTIVGSNPAPSLYKSKLEAAWANYLHGLWMLKAISHYFYEPLNLRLPGGKNFYKPDFLVISESGLTFYEVKGRNKSDDRSLVKIKTAAGLTPWAKFVLVKRINGQWEERSIV